MNQKTQIESKLECKATASLASEVIMDLLEEDKPIESLLDLKENKETDETKNG